MKERWNALSRQDKWLRGSQIFLSFIVIVAAGLQLSGFWPDAGLLTTPTLGLVLILQSIADWKVNRITSAFGFLAAASVFTMYSIGLYLK